MAVVTPEADSKLLLARALLGGQPAPGSQPGTQPQTSFLIPAGSSAEDIAMRRQLAASIFKEGMDTSPIQSPWQGAARLAQALVGGATLGGIAKEDAADKAAANEMLGSIFGGSKPASVQSIASGGTMSTGTPLSPPVATEQRSTEPTTGNGRVAVTEGGLPSPGVATAAAPAAPDQPRMQIARLLSNRYTAPLGQAVAAKVLEQQLAPKDTDEIREYNLARSQGDTRSFTDWKIGVKQAGATKINNVVNAGETAFAKGAGEGMAKRYNDLAKDAQDANALIGDISAIRDIGTRIQTGKTAEAKRMIGPYAQALGINIKDLNDIQAYSAIISRIQPRMRVAGSGATSDYEMKQFLQALPNLSNQPGGNEMIANTLEALQQTKRAAGVIASRALSGEIKPAEAEKMLRELPDPFTAWKKSRGSSPTSTGSGLKSKYGLE